jgi:hypothetical protein
LAVSRTQRLGAARHTITSAPCGAKLLRVGLDQPVRQQLAHYDSPEFAMAARCPRRATNMPPKYKGAANKGMAKNHTVSESVRMQADCAMPSLAQVFSTAASTGNAKNNPRPKDSAMNTMVAATLETSAIPRPINTEISTPIAVTQAMYKWTFTIDA